MILPNFLCIGAQKSGTTFLHEVLSLHPDIYLPSEKEIHYFDNDEYFSQGLDWYKKFFFNETQQKYIGEITPSYVFFEDVPKRIKTTLGENIKVILILRNPIDRAYSHYLMQYMRGIEKLSFNKALLIEDARIKMGYREKSQFSYLSRGFYYKQIKKYLDYFCIGDIKVIIFEEFFSNIKAGINDVLSFLNCDLNFTVPDKEKTNSTQMSFMKYVRAVLLNQKVIQQQFPMFKHGNYPELGKEYRKFLSRKFEDDIIKLQLLIHKDLSMWLRESL